MAGGLCHSWLPLWFQSREPYGVEGHRIGSRWAALSMFRAPHREPLRHPAGLAWRQSARRRTAAPRDRTDAPQASPSAARQISRSWRSSAPDRAITSLPSGSDQRVRSARHTPRAGWCEWRVVPACRAWDRQHTSSSPSSWHSASSKFSTSTAPNSPRPRTRREISSRVDPMKTRDLPNARPLPSLNVRAAVTAADAPHEVRKALQGEARARIGEVVLEARAPRHVRILAKRRR